MYRLPPAIEKELQDKYPNVHVPMFIQSLFQSIVKMTFDDGCCSIREFGKFISFVTYSGKLNSQVVRFKFRLSPSIREKMRKDSYLLENLPIKAQCDFGKEHEEKCNNELKLANQKAVNDAISNHYENNRNFDANQLILDLVKDEEDDD